MDENGFIVDGGYTGYVFLGWAEGNFESSPGSKMPYRNMFVFSPVSSFTSDDYRASGYKAVKLKCVSSDVWKGLRPGDKLMLHFDDKRRVFKAEVIDF